MPYCTVVRSASLNILLYILLSFVLLYIHLNPHMKLLQPTGSKTKIKRLFNILTANGQNTHFICQKLYLKRGKRSVNSLFERSKYTNTSFYFKSICLCINFFSKARCGKTGCIYMQVLVVSGHHICIIFLSHKQGSVKVS